jgi:hypothetical protein
VVVVGRHVSSWRLHLRSLKRAIGGFSTCVVAFILVDISDQLEFSALQLELVSDQLLLTVALSVNALALATQTFLVLALLILQVLLESTVHPKGRVESIFNGVVCAPGHELCYD